MQGLSLTMTPFMPAMGHGASQASLSTELGAGCYAFQEIVLSMSGTWELRTAMTGTLEDSASLTVYVQ
jgi:hypothetical protein